ncbi:biotin transporter BioY [Methanofollis fontis]|uniref:Biotin transporter BioY n=1 Tax=Methanofollis fontis TaxID=2052832 RepID=A0A483CPF4_9EURY|nr:biotin transporter BioY [Methanofollis fontis]TAJ43988.1 biotin transporter BioY [Methanofollis fontis]
MYGDERRSRLIAESAGFLALIAAGAWVSIPFVPIPFTLQTFFVLLSGVVMKRRAVVPAVLYLVLGAIGLPVFHNGTAGPGVLLGPTGGFILGFIPAALAAGIVYEQRSEVGRIAGLAVATLLIYLFGVGWLAISTPDFSHPMGLVPAATIGMLPFLPGDIIKTAAVYMIGRRLP